MRGLLPDIVLQIAVLAAVCGGASFALAGCSEETEGAVDTDCGAVPMADDATPTKAPQDATTTGQEE